MKFKRRHCGEQREAEAASSRQPDRGSLGRMRKWNKKRPKTYAQIKAENRRRGSVAGWRGQPVLGGGHDQNWRDPMFTVAEV